MAGIDRTALEAALDALPKLYPGPGGVAGVMQDGRVVAARAWGYADLDAAMPMTRATRMPICSISKQFTCQVLLAAVADPARLDRRVADYLPGFAGPRPTLRQLCDNQSGLRDYWALTVLQGALAEQEFRREDALPLIARMKTGHFRPGTQYSYCNCNFRIVAELIEAETGEPLEALYRKHVWDPAGMATAVLAADTRRPPDGVTGYEGSDATGFFPARNAIYWIGDAGIAASLDDMMAYEGWIDATREDEGGLYRRASAPPVFADGTPARYGHGLARQEIGGLTFTGHGGALRGFRAYRMNAHAARLSVVVMFNHEAAAQDAAESLVRAALGIERPAPAPVQGGWGGQWMAPNGLIVQVLPDRNSARLRYATGAETLLPAAEGRLESPGTVLERTPSGLTMSRPGDNSLADLLPLPALDSGDGAAIAGRWVAPELEAEMEITWRDGAAFARFQGMLGQGRMERMVPAGRDVWLVATRRSMDAPAPGDWTLVVRRDGGGAVTGLTLGCWLARGLDYVRAPRRQAGRRPM